MIGNRVKLFFLFTFTFICTYVIGSELSFSKLSVENGLSNNEVNVIFKDSHGFVWFGTLLGLDRFDGVKIRSYGNKFSDQAENILSLEEDSDKTLWVGTSNGIYKHSLENDLFNKIELDEKIAVNAIKSVSDSILLLGTNKGLILLNSLTNKVYRIALDSENGNEANYIADILPDGQGRCWMATQKGLVRITLDNKHQVKYIYNGTDKKAINNFTTLCRVGKKIYLGTEKEGIIEFDLDTKEFHKNINLGTSPITTVKSNDREKLYVGTNGAGLFVINLRTNDIQNIQKEEDNPGSLSSNSVYSFLLDENQRFWIGTYSGGVNYSSSISGGFRLHEISTDFPAVNKSVRSFYFAENGNNYFGTRNGFVHQNKEGKVFTFKNDLSTNLRSNIVLTVYPFEGNILLGTYGGGISSYDPKSKTMKRFLNDEHFGNSSNYSFTKDKNGHLWIASFNGIYRYGQNNGNLSNYNTQNCALKSNQVFYLTTDSKNRLWAGTNNGVSVFEIMDDSLKAIELPAEIDNVYKVNYITEDQAGNIWICTEIGGLFEFEDKLSSFKVYKQKDGLPDNSVCAIVENSPGSFWISTLRGFCHFSLQNKQFNNYSISDGLPGLVFSPAASNLADDGKLWFGNEKGLVGFYPENLDDLVVQSRVVITNLYIAGQNIIPGEESQLKKPIEFCEKIVLNYKSSNIGFRFVDLNYLSPFDNNYYTMLEGHDQEWHNNGNSNDIFYDRLKPGEYTFKVKNVVSAGEDSEGIREINIIVKQAFTQSVFFWIGLFIVVLLLGLYLYRIFRKLTNLQKKYNSEHDEVNKYQSSGLREQDLKDIIEKVKKYIKTEKAYLNPNLKLSTVSNELNIPSHHISQALNQLLDQGFSDLINKYRVMEVKYMLENDALQKLTLLAIAKQCGFNSKTSFYRVFKKLTGRTPADYLNELKHDNNHE